LGPLWDHTLCIHPNNPHISAPSVGKRINSATLIADVRHSWLDALSSAGALAGLIAVAIGCLGVTRWPGWR
jgi:divalent metal cation (Fe/Co/Zn/Cd) transporter